VLVLFLSIGALLARTSPKDNSYSYLTIFSNVIHLVDSNYVDDVDFNKVLDSALQGMVENLDGESFFIRGKDLAAYKKQLQDNEDRADVGITLSKRLGMVVVVAVEKESTAHENKIKAGDFIRSIDTQYVQNFALYHIYHLLKGDPGTQVKVSVFRSALEKPEEFTLTRRSVRKPYLESYIAEPKIGYIRIIHLRPGVENEIEKKLEAFGRQGVQQLILDLRGCTEENLDLAVKVADVFVGATTIVQVSSRAGTSQTIVGDDKIAFKGRLLALTDYTTVGGAEIIAGAIQDSGAGKIFGTRTFGRGGVQKLLPAGENYVVLTTQKYLTPKGRTILQNGVEPAIPYKEELKKADQAEEEDRMLNQAIEQLRYPEKKAA